jgi:hypothetical protein
MGVTCGKLAVYKIRNVKHWDGIVPTRTRGTGFGKLGDRWKVRQLQPAGDIGAQKARRKAWVRGHVQVSGDVRFGGDPVQEFAFS